MSSNWRCVLCFNATHVAARAAPKAGIVTYMDKCLSQGRDWKDIPVPRHFIFFCTFSIGLLTFFNVLPHMWNKAGSYPDSTPSPLY